MRYNKKRAYKCRNTRTIKFFSSFFGTPCNLYFIDFSCFLDVHSLFENSKITQKKKKLVVKGKVFAFENSKITQKKKNLVVKGKVLKSFNNSLIKKINKYFTYFYIHISSFHNMTKRYFEISKGSETTTMNATVIAQGDE